MKKQFERLDNGKFNPLSHQSLAHVLGGRTTGSGREPSGWETKEVPNPDAPGTTMTIARPVYKTWTSDEIDGRDSCFYGLGTAYGEWH
jgi:hypothetical protein